MLGLYTQVTNRNTMILLFLLLLHCRAYDHIIIGAGSGGLQMGLFMQKSNVSYIIYEKESVAGSFWNRFPVTEEMISVNSVDPHERYDWNSLLESPIPFKNITERYFPLRHEYQTYLQHIANTLNVEYETRIDNIIEGPCIVFSNGTTECAKKVFIATGLTPKRFPHLDKILPSYQHFNISDIKGERVCIHGNGNSAWEIAQAAVPYARSVMVLGRRPTRWSMFTKYTGDVRIKYAQPLENFQTKLLSFTSTLFQHRASYEESMVNFITAGNRQFRCDKHFLAWGFRSSVPGISINGTFPEDVGHWYESTVKDAHYIGWHMHAQDFKISSGGFIQGFRYLIRNLWQHIHGYTPQRIPINDLVTVLKNRLVNAADILIMQDGATLRDIFVPDKGDFLFYEGYNYNFFKGHDSAITLHFGWGNVHDARTVIGEQYWDGESPMEGQLRNVLLHPIVSYKNVSFHFKEHPTNNWEYQDENCEVIINDILRNILFNESLPDHWVTMPDWKYVGESKAPRDENPVRRHHLQPPGDYDRPILSQTLVDYKKKFKF